MVTVDSAATAIERREITVPGGVRLQYVQSGLEDGAPVILLHGISDSAFSFSRILPLMPSHLRVIALDLRGHGDSDRPGVGYTMDALAADVLAVMDGLQIRRATLVGHSMGSFVARRAAEEAADRVERLVLVGSAVTARNSAIEALLTATESMADPVDESFIWEFQASTIRRPVPADFFTRVIAESRKLPARVWKNAAAGLWAYHPMRPITCPTTILGGDRDAVFSIDEHIELFDAIPSSTLHLEPGIGHTLHWEAPERFVSLAFEP